MIRYNSTQKSSMKYLALLIVISVFLPKDIAAQINFPRISPDCEIKQRIGLTDVSIQYGRPSKRGRQVMGVLVPYGRIWRVGANESTKFTTNDDLVVAGNELPAGTYALYAFPYEDRWQMVFHTNTTHWGDGRNDYDPAEDAFRFWVTPETLKDTVETLTIEFTNFTHQSADLTISWENTCIRFPIEVDTHRKMMAEIQQQIKTNPTADTYYQSARYLQEEGRDPEQALAWLNKALEIGGDTYYFHRVKSLVEAELGQYEAAIDSATKSKALAAQQDKDEFVRMNERNIATWRKLLSKKK